MNKLNREFSLAKAGEPLGLACSPRGLSLAGAPLLQPTATGFAPRPVEELAMLMKAAYGAEDWAADLAGGLRVVADALNHNDLARAMVAAVRLRLPPLDWPAGERLARAEAGLAKFDPNEPRDERGRWTTGGGEIAAPASRPAGAPARPPSVSPDRSPPRANSFTDADDLCSMAFGANPFAAGPAPDPLDTKVLRYLVSRANDWRYSVDLKTGALMFEGKPLDAAATQVWKERQLGAASGRPGVVSEPEQALRTKFSQMSPAQAEVATYPHALDGSVDKYVAQYNQSKGFRPGDQEYLDPDLIKAMIMQESAHDLKAFNSDPMQVNKHGDWFPEKASLGLIKDVAPGQDLSIQAGIGWLSLKSYHHSDAGAPDRFFGWHTGVAKYNGGGVPGYTVSVFRHLNLLKQSQEERAQ